jgi:hypothetical protein
MPNRGAQTKDGVEPSLKDLQSSALATYAIRSCLIVLFVLGFFLSSYIPWLRPPFPIQLQSLSEPISCFFLKASLHKWLQGFVVYKNISQALGKLTIAS